MGFSAGGRNEEDGERISRGKIQLVVRSTDLEYVDFMEIEKDKECQHEDPTLIDRVGIRSRDTIEEMGNES